MNPWHVFKVPGVLFSLESFNTNSDQNLALIYPEMPFCLPKMPPPLEVLSLARPVNWQLPSKPQGPRAADMLITSGCKLLFEQTGLSVEWNLSILWST